MNVWIGASSAFWLGILTSLSPCPLATNIAAISFTAQKFGSKWQTLITGLLYTLGRVVAYIAVGYVVILGILSIPMTSMFLQKYINQLLGPSLILVGMLLLELITLPIASRGRADKWRKLAEKAGWGGTILLGVTFALAFCPVSAALFFGSLLPLSIKYQSRFLLPACYGIGTGLPVVIFSVLLAWGSNLLGKVFQQINLFERWARLTTGIIFILVGIYLTLIHVFSLRIYR